MTSDKLKLTLCYWIVGRDTDRPAVAIDLHDENGDLIGETRTFARNDAHTFVLDYAHNYGIKNIVFDNDSTEYFAND